MEILRTLLVGVVIGIANIIPGVSGGTLAVVFGIYDKFVNAITLNVKKLWKNKAFILPLLLGIIIGILLFSKAISYLLERFPIQLNFFFTGIILGSIPLIWGFCTESNHTKNNDTYKKTQTIKSYIPIIICFVIGLAIMLLFSMLEKNSAQMKAIVGNDSKTNITFFVCLKLFIAGVVSAVAMIIPGISGSFLLLIMGAYSTIISAISVLVSSLRNAPMLLHAFLLLLPCGIGIIIGLLGGAKIVSILLKKVKKQTYSVILGLVVGSAITLCPKTFNGLSVITIVVCIICVGLGFCTSFFSAKYSKA